MKKKECIVNRDNYKSIVEESYFMLTDALKVAKEQLTEALFHASDILEQREDGKWRLFSQNIQNECIVEVKTRCGNPTASDLKSYRWIPILIQ